MIEPTMKPEAVRKALIDYRAEHNLSLRRMAKKVGGVTGATLGNIERGSVWPMRTTLLKIERFLRREGVLSNEAAA